MPDITSYQPGTPSWIELATTDAAGAMRFYGGLFGWKDNPQPMGPGQVYHMQQLRGREASAIYDMGADERAQMPAHWRVYFTVRDVDETVRRAAAAGGIMVAGPMDVFDAGRMAMIRDPQGAMFAVWQAKNHIGCRVAHEPGALDWVELTTTDGGAAARFYAAVLGVQTAGGPMMQGYTMLKVDGVDVAGLRAITPQMGPMPAHWGIYFQVASTDGTVSQAQGLGGKVVVPPTDIPNAVRFARLQDPQGGYFGVFQPALRPAAAVAAPARTVVTSKTPARKAPARMVSASKTHARKAPARMVSASKTPVRKAPARKAVVSKTSARKAPARTAATSRNPARKAPARTAATSRNPARKAPARKAATSKTPARKARRQ